MNTLSYVVMSTAVGLGMYWGIGGAVHLYYYRARKDRAEEWKCQPKRWLPPKLSRHQLLLGSANMLGASILSGLFSSYVASGGRTAIFFHVSDRGVVFTVLSTLLYFLATDMGLYWAHRTLHRPLLFKYIHRWHHRYIAPTPITAMAMHPLELALYQSIMLVPLFFFPVHVVGLIMVLVYQNLVALVDHSGVDGKMILPWQPPARFHDDHHLYFHVNYGQNLGLWDRVFGTWRREGRVYGEHVFGGRGAPIDGKEESGPPRFIDYSKKLPFAEERPGRALAPKTDP